jgi:hypothetical protein
VEGGSGRFGAGGKTGWDGIGRDEAVRCGAVWCGVIRYCVIRCSALLCGTVRCDAVRCGALCYEGLNTGRGNFIVVGVK